MDSGLKKRLLGAFVLIVLAVIFVPMLLPGHSDSGQSVNMKIPPEPSGELQTQTLKVGPDAASAGSSTAAATGDPDHVATLDLEHRSAQAQASQPAPSVAATSTAVAAPVAANSGGTSATALQVAPTSGATKPAASAPASGVTQVAAATSGPVAGGAGAAANVSYDVNLGIYADRASANKLVAQARQHGYTAHATAEAFHGKPVLRVKVGPFDSRAQAEAARLKLKSFEHVSSMVVDSNVANQTGDAPTSAIAAGKPGAWAVQLAAFSDQASANKLRDRLRTQGFDGYVDSVDTAKGKLWRVRAGPYASRALAGERRDQITQKLKVKGDIVTEH